MIYVVIAGWEYSGWDIKFGSTDHAPAVEYLDALIEKQKKRLVFDFIQLIEMDGESGRNLAEWRRSDWLSNEKGKEA